MDNTHTAAILAAFSNTSTQKQEQMLYSQCWPTRSGISIIDTQIGGASIDVQCESGFLPFAYRLQTNQRWKEHASRLRQTCRNQSRLAPSLSFDLPRTYTHNTQAHRYRKRHYFNGSSLAGTCIGTNLRLSIERKDEIDNNLLLPGLGVRGYRWPFAFSVHNVNIRRLHFFEGTGGQSGSQTSQSSTYEKWIVWGGSELVKRLSVVWAFCSTKTEISDTIHRCTHSHTYTHIHTHTRTHTHRPPSLDWMEVSRATPHTF